jgi:hypothetical protein
MSGFYKIRTKQNGTKGSLQSELTVPAPIAAVVPDGEIFVCELTEDGILYRPLGTPPPVKAPAWTNQPDGGAA